MAPRDTPYREPTFDVAQAPKPLVVVWRDSTFSYRARATLRVYYLVLAALVVLAAIALVSPIASAVIGLALLAHGIARGSGSVRPGFSLSVEGDLLKVVRSDLEAAKTVAVSSVRDVEIERKGIERRSDVQRLGPMMEPTALNGAQDTARITLVLDGGERVRLSEDYAPVFLCLEDFGKVRSFLRRAGWRPVGERDPDEHPAREAEAGVTKNPEQ